MELVFFLIIFELNRYSACISLNIKQKAQIPLFFKLIRKYREKACFYKSTDNSTSPTGSENHLASFQFQNTFLLNV